jgi:hypothetical protein
MPILLWLVGIPIPLIISACSCAKRPPLRWGDEMAFEVEQGADLGPNCGADQIPIARSGYMAYRDTVDQARDDQPCCRRIGADQ